ncbi:MAG: nuclear transport factor 2 family protein [Verrucomicrobiota bacterium]
MPSKLKALEEHWEASLATHDASVIEKVVANDFVGTSSGGRLGSKATLLAEMRRDKNTYKSAASRQMSVHVYGSNVAVVFGTAKESGTDPSGRAFARTYRFTDTWVKRGGEWQCVAAHTMAMPNR